MNLIKKSSALLAAISAFALTSCGPKQIGFIEARKWLKDAKTEEAETKAIEKETFEWDVTVTGTGMKPSEGKVGGAQFVLAALIYEERWNPTLTELVSELLPATTKLKDTFKDESKKAKERKAGDDIMSFVNQEGIMEIETWSDTYDHEHSIDGDLLHLKFGREEVVDIAGHFEATFNFTQEMVIKKSGYTSYWSISADNMKVKIDDSYQGITVVADGTMSGTIKGTFTLAK